ncbi:hypothetical protein Tco_1166447, partial [Tanacetum coccineum]
MKTLASVEIEIMFILGMTCCLSSSSARCLESADGAQSSRVPVPLPEDPYEAIRQAYLDGTDTESELFEDPVETETPESPLTIAQPIPLPESTPPTLVPILRRTARMAVRVLPAMLPGLSASMAEVAAMSESAFRKRFRSSYESSPSSSPPDLPSRKRYRGTSELVEDSEEDDDEEDEEIEESLDSDSASEDAEDEGPTAEDEDPAAGDEGPGMGVESHGLDDESRGLDDEGHSVESDGLSLGEEEEAVPMGQQWAVPVVGTAVSTPLGLGYRALRRRELALEEDHVYSTFDVDLEEGMVYIYVPAYPPQAPPVQTPPSPESLSGSLSISPTPSIVPSPISSPMIPLTVPSPVATPATAKADGFLTELGAQVEMNRGIDSSLEHEQERVAVTFGVLWRLVLALESWACQIDTQRASLWHAISDTQGENRELRLQLAEERRAWVDLAKIVDNIGEGRSPKEMCRIYEALDLTMRSVDFGCGKTSSLEES